MLFFMCALAYCRVYFFLDFLFLDFWPLKNLFTIFIFFGLFFWTFCPKSLLQLYFFLDFSYMQNYALSDPGISKHVNLVYIFCPYCTQYTPKLNETGTDRKPWKRSIDRCQIHQIWRHVRSVGVRTKQNIYQQNLIYLQKILLEKKMRYFPGSLV